MRTPRLAATQTRDRAASKSWRAALASVQAAGRLAQGAALPVLIFVVVFAAYHLLSHQPSAVFKHQVYQAQALLKGRLDLEDTGLPSFYHDVVVVEGKRYLTVPPAPAVLLLPFVAIWGVNFAQADLSIALGAVNVVLFWYLLTMLNVSRTTTLLLVPFFAFGTVHFFAATSGTTWHYAHIAAVFFLLLAVISLLRRLPPVVPGIFLGFAFLSREPTIFAAPFFLYWIWRQRHPSLSWRSLTDKQSLLQMSLFCAALAAFVGFYAWYNYARFGSAFSTGYDILYQDYTARNDYSFYRAYFPDSPHFNMFDVRNIPLHLYTIFLMPPQYVPDWSVFRPSPYGMSVLLTSPAFLYAAFVKRRDALKTASWLAIALVSVPLFLHYTQGWYQFGYRFLLDFAPFLLILTAFGFEDHRSPGATRMKLLLVAVSIVAGFWGVHWGTKLGW